MWSGSSSNIPSGWLLCNGSNGTPDLRDRFIVGTGGSYGVGFTGGEVTHTLTIAEMPRHNHTFTGKSHTHTLNLTGLTCSEAGEHSHSVEFYRGSNAGQGNNLFARGVVSNGSLTETTSSTGAHTHEISGTGSLGATTATGTINNTGSGTAHENRPPYYALCFIMKQ